MSEYNRVDHCLPPVPLSYERVPLLLKNTIKRVRVINPSLKEVNVYHSTQGARAYDIPIEIEARRIQQKLQAVEQSLPTLDSRMQEHVDRVTEFACSIGDETGELNPLQRVLLYYGSKFHDVGKHEWTEELLDIYSIINRKQFEEFVVPHPQRGLEIFIRSIQRLNYEDNYATGQVAKIILGHHLFWNNQGGYPTGGLSQDFLTSIVTIADAFDAMVFRPYSRFCNNPDAAIEEIMRCMGFQFNPQLKEALLNWYSKSKQHVSSLYDAVSAHTLPEASLIEKEQRKELRQLRHTV